MTEPQNETTPVEPQVEATPMAAPPVAAPPAPADVQAPAPAPADVQAPAPADVQAPAPAGAEVPAEAQALVEPARGGSRKKLALAAAGVAAAVLVSGGVWGASAVADADRTAPTRYWAAEGKPLAKPEKPAAVPPNELSGKLLPVPSSFSLGPDLADDGNNFFLSGDNAVQGFKDSRKGLSSTERKKRDEALAELKLKGLAGRSYTRADGRMIFEVRIMQADPASLGKFSEVSKKLMDLIGDGRDAPKIDGYPDAKCSLLAIGEEKKEKIDSLDCVAIEGDVLVNFRAYGPKPFSGDKAAEFFKSQLNHLKSPGESA